MYDLSKIEKGILYLIILFYFQPGNFRKIFLKYKRLEERLQDEELTKKVEEILKNKKNATKRKQKRNANQGSPSNKKPNILKE